MTARAASTPPSRVVERAPVLLAVAVVLVALNLRSPLTSLPPLLLTIADDLHLGGAAAGVLTTLPVLCMGLFAPGAQRLGQRLGRETAIIHALLLLLAGTLLRLGGGTLAVLYLAAAVTGVGIAIAGTLLPGLVKEHFAARSGLMTGLYMAGMFVGASVAAQAAVPLADALGSWQRSLASWSVLVVVALAAWVPASRSLRADHALRDPAPGGGLPWRSATAWLLAAYLVGNSWQFYTQVAWIPATYEDLGRTSTAAATLLTVFTVVQAVFGVAAPALADRVRDLRLLIFPAVLLDACGTAGVAVAPEAAPLLWMLLLSAGLGAGFALGLVLLVRYAATPAAAGRLSALVFLVSYTVAGAGPVVFGALRDSTGGTRLPWALLVVVALLQLLAVLRLNPARRRIE